MSVPDIDCVAELQWRRGHHCPLNDGFLLKQILWTKQRRKRQADIVLVSFIYLFFHFVIMTLPVSEVRCGVALRAAQNV